jgi:hypothetical protein
LPEEIVLWPLEEMFRRRVIAFLEDQELLPRDRAEMLLSWQHSGFSLHRSRRVGHEEREDLEQIARYILPNPFSTAKMPFEPGAGSVLYRSRMNKKQGGNFAALSPTDFIAAVTQHIPDKGFQLVRYYGWYSHKARGVRAKTGAAQAEDSAQGHEPDRAPTSAQWRRLIAKIGEADPLTCPRLRGRIEDSGLHRGGPRHRKNSQASGPTPRRLARSAAPGARLRADLQRLVRRGRGRRCLPALLSAQRAFGDGPFLLPGARPGHPEAQNAPRTSERSPKRR